MGDNNPNSHLSNKDRERCERRLYSLHKSKGKRKGGWNINRLAHKILTQQPCQYCGADPSNTLKYAGLEYHYNGLDRIDNGAGYNPDNVVTACSFCNSLRGPMKFETWSSFLAAVIWEHGGVVPDWLVPEDADRADKSFYRHA